MAKSVAETITLHITSPPGKHQKGRFVYRLPENLQLENYNSNQIMVRGICIFSLITHEEIYILLFGVLMVRGKQKTPGDITRGVFCFPRGNQKTPSAVCIQCILFVRLKFDELFLTK